MVTLLAWQLQKQTLHFHSPTHLEMPLEIQKLTPIPTRLLSTEDSLVTDLQVPMPAAV